MAGARSQSKQMWWHMWSGALPVLLREHAMTGRRNSGCAWPGSCEHRGGGGHGVASKSTRAMAACSPTPSWRATRPLPSTRSGSCSLARGMASRLHPLQRPVPPTNIASCRA